MKHAKQIAEHRRLRTDGMPLLWYFDTRTQIGFSWTGGSAEPIEVSVGGYAEPVTHIIDKTIAGKPLVALAVTSTDIIKFFGEVCEEWLQRITADIGAKEPQLVKEVW
jgi:hypothetical protein